jgi:hypothetical protein
MVSWENIMPDIDQAPTNTPEVSTADEEHFHLVLADMTAIKDQYVEENRRWYFEHSKRPMVMFRTVGVLLIVLSASVPLLSTLDGLWRTIVLPAVAVSIAVLAGLNAFFQWNETWQWRDPQCLHRRRVGHATRPAI